MTPMNNRLRVRVNSQDDKTTAGGIVLVGTDNDDCDMVWSGVLEEASHDCWDETFKKNLGATVYFDKRGALGIPGVKHKDQAIYFVDCDKVYAMTYEGDSNAS